MSVNTIQEALEDIKQGKIIIVVDSEDRENEGDFVVSAELITPEIVNFMSKYGRGLICVALDEERCNDLDLHLMVGRNTSNFDTPFTISVDLIGNGCTTGISAQDRAKTIKALIDKDTNPEQLARPGHIFPLKAKNKGVLQRAGHTEASVDLSILAGLEPGGVLVEILNEDGTMARLPELIEIAKKWNIKIVTIKDLIAYRLEKESLIERGEKVNLPTKYGNFQAVPYRQVSNGLEHLAIIKGNWNAEDEVLVRVHSSCLTGDLLGSLRCDCGPQLHKSLSLIEKTGQGAVIYLQQEGRGIGLCNKMKAYKLQDEGMDTIEANLKLGFREDERDYGIGAQIIRDLGISKVQLITNNPLKRAGLEGYGIQIVKNIKNEIKHNEYNYKYLKTKKEKMGHFIDIE